MAVNEAINGNLEKSRYLSEISFQALSGQIPNNIPIPTNKIIKIDDTKVPEIVNFTFETLNTLENITQNPQIYNTSQSYNNLLNLIEYYKNKYLSSAQKFDFDLFQKVTQSNNDNPININQIEQIQNEIELTKQNLQKVKENLYKLNFELIKNIKEYEKWVEEAEKYRKNIYQNSYSTLANLTIDHVINLSQKLLPEYKQNIEFLKFTKNYSEFSLWFYQYSQNLEDQNLEKLYEGLNKLIQLLPIQEKIKDFINFLNYVVQTSYDSFNLYISFQQFKKYDQIIQTYSKAINQQKDYIKKLEQTIKEKEKYLNKLKHSKN